MLFLLQLTYNRRNKTICNGKTDYVSNTISVRKYFTWEMENGH